MVDFLIACEKLKETNPQLWGVIVGVCIGIVLSGVAMTVLMLIELNISKKNKKVMEATDLIGENVIYSSTSMTVEGQVVSVDYVLGESGKICATVYIYVGGLIKYVKVDYATDGAKIKLKEGRQ